MKRGNESAASVGRRGNRVRDFLKIRCVFDAEEGAVRPDFVFFHQIDSLEEFFSCKWSMNVTGQSKKRFDKKK